MAVTIFALLALAQVVLNIHSAVDEHTQGIACEICVAQHQLGDAIPNILSISTALIELSFIAFAITPLLLCRQLVSLRSRGPPAL